tara:strand:- start:88 stop:372 length:285 start_codon:yes stop_codon:yes gene_type:complete
MKKGILKTLIFYGIGAGIAIIVAMTKPHHNTLTHGPVLELEDMVLFSTFIIGLIWTLVSFFKFLYNSSENLKGIIITNSLIILGMLISLFIVGR